MIFAVLALGFYAVMLFLIIGGIWKTFSKAGQPGWACLIPVYNFLVMADVARVPRSKAWMAMAAFFIGAVINIVVAFQYINTSGQMDSAGFTGGLLIYLALYVIGLVLMFPIYKGIAVNFGQGVGFAWGLMLMSVVFFAILGFGAYRYQGGSYLNDDLLDSGI